MIPDVNVLVAAARADHVHHEIARAWLEKALDAAQGGESLEVLPAVIASFLRLVTHPRIFVEPTPTENAIAFVDALLKCPGVEMPEGGREWPALRELCRAHALAGNDVPDAWIAAHVKTLHGHLVTFDRGFARLLGRGEVTVLATKRKRVN